MNSSEYKTGTPDPIYNLISVLYHSLQGAETYEQYQRDAEQAGDQDLASFFREMIEGNKIRAERIKFLLAKHLKTYSPKNIIDQASKASFPASDPPAHGATL